MTGAVAIVAISGVGSHDISALAGFAPVARVVFQSIGGDGRRLNEIRFAPEPAAGALGLAALAALARLRAARRR